MWRMSEHAELKLIGPITTMDQNLKEMTCHRYYHRHDRSLVFSIEEKEEAIFAYWESLLNRHVRVCMYSAEQKGHSSKFKFTDNQPEVDVGIIK